MPMPKHPAAVLLTTAGFALAVGVGACKSEETTTDDDGTAIADVLYEGGATDEGLEAVLDKTPVEDKARAARFLWPSNGEIVSTANAPIEIWWDLGTNADARPAPSPSLFAPPSPIDPRWPVAPAAQHARIAPTFGERALDFLLGGVSTAHAHGTPMTGSGFFLTFSTPTNPKLLRVFTKSLGYVPDETKTALLTGQTEMITLTLVNAELVENRLAPDGGPFQTPVIEVGFRP